MRKLSAFKAHPARAETMIAPDRSPGRSGTHAEPECGQVVAVFGRRVQVEDHGGARHGCMIAGRRLRPVCGDRVAWSRPEGQNEALLVSIEPRHNELARPSRRGRKEVLAANIDQLLVVVAPTPRPDPFLVDRYLAAAELMCASGCVIMNKSDIPEAAKTLNLGEFEDCGYPAFQVSTRSGTGLDRLTGLLCQRTSILVGQSGVGKSSLLNALVPDLALGTGAVSQATGEGTHTTTTAVLHHLPAGGGIIDSPGVRDFAPPAMDPDTVASGFREIADLARDCRFGNCVHLREPGCAVKDAVANGRLSARRYESYRRLVRLMEQLGSRS